jgi:hypothetical protein
MIFSRQFRALLRFAGVWAIPWCVIGAGLALVRWLTSGGTLAGQSLGVWVLNHVLGYGALGLLSGLFVGLLLARQEEGRRVEDLSARRMALWGAIGGAGPAVVFAAVGVVVGAPTIVYLPVLGLGLLSAVVSGGLATAAVASGKGRRLPPGDEAPTLRGP